jgi:glycosyltransferase involved in cell wall biosynthesis
VKILLAIPSMDIGGAERVVTMLARELAGRGHEITIVAPPGELDEDLRDVGHVRIAIDDHGRNVRGAPGSVLRLAGVVRSVKPDVIHAQNPRYTGVARAASIVGSPGRFTPLLATFHGAPSVEYRRAALLLRLAGHVACVSDSVLEGIVRAGLPPARASLVRNGIEVPSPLDRASRDALDRELGLGEAPVVAIVGRLVTPKAHERFVVAAQLLAQARPQVQFLIVGDGPRRGEIEHAVTDAGIADRVLFTGSRSDATKIIARVQLLVFSSDSEGLSIAALEALAAGTPVVSTDVEGMRELLAGGAGAIVPLDDGTALGERIIELLDDESELLHMGRTGSELVAREFSLEKMIDAYEELYEQLIHD